VVNLKGGCAVTALASLISCREVSDRLKETLSCCSQKREEGARSSAGLANRSTNKSNLFAEALLCSGNAPSARSLASNTYFSEALRALVLFQLKAVWL